VGHPQRGRPWSGLVKNRCKNGDHYWVRASVTPKPEGGFMSVRVRPERAEVDAAEALYQRMRSDPGLRLHEGEPAGAASPGSPNAWRPRRPHAHRPAPAAGDGHRDADARRRAGRQPVLRPPDRDRIPQPHLGRHRPAGHLRQALRPGAADGPGPAQRDARPRQPKAYENYAKAAESFEKLLASARDADTQHFRSGLPDKIGALRGEQRQVHDQLFALVKSGQLDAARSTLNKDETPKWREIRDLLQTESGASTSSHRSCWRGSSNNPISSPAQHRAGRRRR
jgi:hypothetical protein